MNIGGRIEIRLKQLGKGRDYLLERLPDLSPQALSNLIKRDSKRSEWDEKIAEALGVPVMWLVYGHEHKSNIAAESNSVYQIHSSHVQAVAQAMSELDESTQLYLRGRIEGWIEGHLAPNFAKRVRNS